MLAKNYWFDKPRPKGLAFTKGAYPRGFTGKKDNRYFYQGKPWLGHTGFIGCEDWPQRLAQTRNA